MSAATPDQIRKHYRGALSSLVEKLEEDRTVLAAILFGSLSYDEVWVNSDIDLWIIMRDGVKEGHVTLCEDDVNIRAQTVPRSVFKRRIEGDLAGGWLDFTFSKSTLLFTKDDSVAKWYDAIDRIGTRDRAFQLMRHATFLIPSLNKAEKYFYLKNSFDLDTPYKDLSDDVRDLLLYGTRGERVVIEQPPDAKVGAKYIGREFRYDGVINQIERQYRRYRQKGVAHGGMEDYLRKTMVENPCPDCGGERLKKQRLLVTIDSHNVHSLGEMHLPELLTFLKELAIPSKQKEVVSQIVHEISSRLELLIGIGLDYLNLNRPTGTLSGGESQRIRLSTQIGSGLMGMLYVLDEPSIGLHPKDNVKMIGTMRHLSLINSQNKNIHG